MDPAPTEIYTLSLHDALPILTARVHDPNQVASVSLKYRLDPNTAITSDRKSTRLNSSHLGISYAVFCLKKKNNVVQEKQIYFIGSLMLAFTVFCAYIRF